MSLDHTAGRETIRHVWRKLFDREPTNRELQAVAAVSIGESPYGNGVFKVLDLDTGEVLDTVSGTNNWGAIQAISKPPCPSGTFMATDTSPQPDGTSRRYNACFRQWDSPESGASAFLSVLLTGKRAMVAEAISHGTAGDIARAMYETRYYEGSGATVEQRIAGKARSIEEAGRAIAKHFGEPYMLAEAASGTSAKGTMSGTAIPLLLALAALLFLARK